MLIQLSSAVTGMQVDLARIIRKLFPEDKNSFKRPAMLTTPLKEESDFHKYEEFLNNDNNFAATVSLTN